LKIKILFFSKTVGKIQILYQVVSSQLLTFS
jgi:hypothetical protein